MTEPGSERVDAVAVLLVVVAAALLAAGRLPLGVAVGVLAAGTAGYVEQVGARVALLAVGAWLVSSHGGLAPFAWIRLTVGETVLIGGALVASRWGRCPHHDDGVHGAIDVVLVAGTVLGVALTVPDTEQVRVAAPAASAAVVAIALLLRHGAHLTSRALPGAFALVAWLAGVGGFGRGGAVVGAIGCLGLMVIVPTVRGLAGTVRFDALDDHARRLLTVVMHGVLVLWAARFAGLRQERWEALAIIALQWVVVAALLGPRPTSTARDG